MGAKSSLKYINIDSCQIGKVHNSWKLTSNSFRDVHRTQIKGSYIHQSNRSKFNKYTVPYTCLLCKVESEEVRHNLLEYPKLQPVRVGNASEIEQIRTAQYYEWPSVGSPWLVWGQNKDLEQTFMFCSTFEKTLTTE